MKVLTFSRVFPAYHPKKGQPTNFVEKIYNGLYSKNNLMDYPLGLDIDDTVKGMKHHTIRAGNHWKVGDKFSPRVWSGKPYNSKQIIIAPDIEIKKVWELIVDEYGIVEMPKAKATTILQDIAKNDGLSIEDFIAWFKDFKQAGTYQIICWNENIEY